MESYTSFANAFIDLLPCPGQLRVWPLGTPQQMVEDQGYCYGRKQRKNIKNTAALDVLPKSSSSTRPCH